MTEAGLALGAGIVLPLVKGACTLHRTAQIVGHLADESAGRCGPCLNGLPALAKSINELDRGWGSSTRAEQLIRLVTKRGACAHPDGTARLVLSLLKGWPREHLAHGLGECTFSTSMGSPNWPASEMVS